MTALAYYNEHDPKKAAWLRELIARELIAPGDVDQRSIEDVLPTELAGYTQCHFFAGIGVWSYALRQAGWPDHRPVWTGSCPCQPFSTAGARAGFADERHLWPALHWLIAQCRPRQVFGEQSASQDALAWLDLVHADLDASGYALGALDLCAAGFGAPHIRQRLYFAAERLADGDGDRRDQAGAGGAAAGNDGAVGDGAASRLGHTNGQRSRRNAGADAGPKAAGAIEGPRARRRGNGAQPAGPARWPGPVNGFWRAADWLSCRDGKWRPIEPGFSALAAGAPARVVRLRGYGDAICAEVARHFIESYMESAA